MNKKLAILLILFLSSTIITINAETNYNELTPNSNEYSFQNFKNLAESYGLTEKNVIYINNVSYDEQKIDETSKGTDIAQGGVSACIDVIFLKKSYEGIKNGALKTMYDNVKNAIKTGSEIIASKIPGNVLSLRRYNAIKLKQIFKNEEDFKTLMQIIEKKGKQLTSLENAMLKNHGLTFKEGALVHSFSNGLRNYEGKVFLSKEVIKSENELNKLKYFKKYGEAIEKASKDVAKAIRAGKAVKGTEKIGKTLEELTKIARKGGDLKEVSKELLSIFEKYKKAGLMSVENRKYTILLEKIEGINKKEIKSIFGNTNKLVFEFKDGVFQFGKNSEKLSELHNFVTLLKRSKIPWYKRFVKSTANIVVGGWRFTKDKGAKAIETMKKLKPSNLKKILKWGKIKDFSKKTLKLNPLTKFIGVPKAIVKAGIYQGWARWQASKIDYLPPTILIGTEKNQLRYSINLNLAHNLYKLEAVRDAFEKNMNEYAINNFIWEATAFVDPTEIGYLVNDSWNYFTENKKIIDSCTIYIASKQEINSETKKKFTCNVKFGDLIVKTEEESKEEKEKINLVNLPAGEYLIHIKLDADSQDEEIKELINKTITPTTPIKISETENQTSNNSGDKELKEYIRIPLTQFFEDTENSEKYISKYCDSEKDKILKNIKFTQNGITINLNPDIRKENNLVYLYIKKEKLELDKIGDSASFDFVNEFKYEGEKYKAVGRITYTIDSKSDLFDLPAEDNIYSCITISGGD